MHFQHTTAFDGPLVNHEFEWKIAQTANASTGQDRWDDPEGNIWSI